MKTDRPVDSSERMRWPNTWDSSLSRPAAGSSSSTSLGSITSALATPTSLRWPWDRLVGVSPLTSSRSTSRSTSSIRPRISGVTREMCSMSKIQSFQRGGWAATSRLSSTVRSSNSSSDWNVRTRPRRVRSWGLSGRRSSPSSTIPPVDPT